MTYEEGLRDQQVRYERFMEAKRSNTTDEPYDDTNEGYMFRSVTSATPEELFDDQRG